MNIPLVEYWDENKTPDRYIGLGPHAGKPCYYKTALFNTLVALQPKLCLEIGTHYGGTTQVFQEYFKRFMPDGFLVTADIKQYVTIADPHVKQVIVYPHSKDVVTRHAVVNSELLPCADKIDSETLNAVILQESIPLWSAFNFAFIDGDHERDSVLRDIEIAKRVTTHPHYMLLDDTKEGIHPISVLYATELVNQYEHFDFEDWPIFCGCSLIWEK